MHYMTVNQTQALFTSMTRLRLSRKDDKLKRLIIHYTGNVISFSRFQFHTLSTWNALDKCEQSETDCRFHYVATHFLPNCLRKVSSCLSLLFAGFGGISTRICESSANYSRVMWKCLQLNVMVPIGNRWLAFFKLHRDFEHHFCVINLEIRGCCLSIFQLHDNLTFRVDFQRDYVIFHLKTQLDAPWKVAWLTSA